MRAFALFTLLTTAVMAYDPVKMLCLVNTERQKAGLKPLGLNDKLQKSAQDHSNDQARMRSMTHTGSDGSSAGARVSRAGYNWRSVGENVAYGYGDEEECMKQWMNSAGHRENILGSFTHFGSAMAKAGNTPYYTQDFGSDGTSGNYPVCPEGGSYGTTDDGGDTGGAGDYGQEDGGESGGDGGYGGGDAGGDAGDYGGGGGSYGGGEDSQSDSTPSYPSTSNGGGSSPRRSGRKGGRQGGHHHHHGDSQPGKRTRDYPTPKSPSKTSYPSPRKPTYGKGYEGDDNTKVIHHRYGDEKNGGEVYKSVQNGDGFKRTVTVRRHRVTSGGSQPIKSVY